MIFPARTFFGPALALCCGFDSCLTGFSFASGCPAWARSRRVGERCPQLLRYSSSALAAGPVLFPALGFAPATDPLSPPNCDRPQSIHRFGDPPAAGTSSLLCSVPVRPSYSFPLVLWLAPFTAEELFCCSFFHQDTGKDL